MPNLFEMILRFVKRTLYTATQTHYTNNHKVTEPVRVVVKKNERTQDLQLMRTHRTSHSFDKFQFTKFYSNIFY